MPGVIDGAVGNRAAEIDVSAVVHGANKFEIAQRAFELGKEMRHRLRVVPHVRARSVAASGVRKAAFPSPDVAVCLAQNGRRLQDGEVGGDGIEHVRRKRGIEERVLELDGARAQGGVVLLHVCSDVARIFPQRGVVRMPWRRAHRPAPCGNQADLQSRSRSARRDSAFAQIAVGKVPCDKDGVGARLAGVEMSVQQDGSAVAAGIVDRI